MVDALKDYIIVHTHTKEGLPLKKADTRSIDRPIITTFHLCLGGAL